MSCGERRAADGSTYYMAECIGGAAMGLAYCTCRETAEIKRRAKEREDRITKLEEKMAALEKRLTKSTV